MQAFLEREKEHRQLLVSYGIDPEAQLDITFSFLRAVNRSHGSDGKKFRTPSKKICNNCGESGHLSVLCPHLDQSARKRKRVDDSEDDNIFSDSESTGLCTSSDDDGATEDD